MAYLKKKELRSGGCGVDPGSRILHLGPPADPAAKPIPDCQPFEAQIEDRMNALADVCSDQDFFGDPDRLVDGLFGGHRHGKNKQIKTVTYVGRYSCEKEFLD